MNQKGKQEILVKAGLGVAIGLLLGYLVGLFIESQSNVAIDSTLWGGLFGLSFGILTSSAQITLRKERLFRAILVGVLFGAVLGPFVGWNWRWWDHEAAVLESKERAARLVFGMVIGPPIGGLMSGILSLLSKRNPLAHR